MFKLQRKLDRMGRDALILELSYSDPKTDYSNLDVTALRGILLEYWVEDYC
jgi:hypothetical protein